MTLDSDALNALVPGADGFVVNTATAQQVTIDREWTISTGGNSVTFPVGTVVTRADDGVFAFYQMTAQQFALDDSVTSAGLDGVPVATLRFGIPGLNLSFSQPVDVSMEVGSQYNGDTLSIQSLTEGGATWANETTCLVVDGRIHFTVDHATRFVATNTASPTVTSFTPASGAVGTTVSLDRARTSPAPPRSASTGTRRPTPSLSAIRRSRPLCRPTPPPAPISITTPCGTAISDAAYTVTAPTPTPTTTPDPPDPNSDADADPHSDPILHRLRSNSAASKSGALKLGKSMTAKGIVTPTSLAGSKVTLTAH